MRFHILLARFSRWLNINRRESRYHQELRRLLPADLLSVFPEQMEPIYSPEHGWGVVESLILNLDGTPARKVCREIRRVDDPALRLRIYRETERLLFRLATHGVRFFDLHNLLIQWTGRETFRLRVADLEPCGKEFVSGLLAWRLLAGCKVRRRARRYLARLRADLFVTMTPDDAGGAGCRTLAEPKPGIPMARRFARVAGLI